MSVLEVVGLYFIIGATLAVVDCVWTFRQFTHWPWAAQDALAWMLAWPLVLLSTAMLAVCELGDALSCYARKRATAHDEEGVT